MAGVPRALLAGRDWYRLATSAPRTAWGFQSRWRTARGVAIHDRCSLAHPNDTTPVVLLHGLAVSHRYLMPLAARLVGHHPVHVVDLPGFGFSGDPGRVLNITEHADPAARRLRRWSAPGRRHPGPCPTRPDRGQVAAGPGAPVLVTRGSREPIVPVAWALAATRLAPLGELAVVPGPHNANHGAADHLGALVRDFLRQRVQAQGGQAS
jgi:pimeloyl-ACP methyl ester carboxylesterase